MARKQSFVLYTDYQSQIDRLTIEQRGVLITAIFAHANEEPEPGMDAATGMAFAFIAAQLDRDNGKWERTRQARAEAGRKGGVASGEVRKTDKANEAIASPLKQNEANEANEAVNVTVPVPVTVTDTVTVTVKESTAPPAASPAPSDGCSSKPIQKKYGSYGWVKLTDEEYSRLLNDLGEPEFKRCIAYIDESAQATSNKNKWRDWNLVLRRCHREAWGLGTAANKSSTRDTPKTSADYEGGESFV